MQDKDIFTIDPNVDYKKILPIQQKRLVAFVNDFVIYTVSFLNTFGKSCESRLMKIDEKIERVKATLMILESKLDSIPGLQDETNNSSPKNDTNSNKKNDSCSSEENLTSKKSEVDNKNPMKTEEKIDPKHDPLYEKFFKMLQFGVPRPAIKNKMRLEGLDPDVID